MRMCLVPGGGSAVSQVSLQLQYLISIFVLWRYLVIAFVDFLFIDFHGFDFQWEIIFHEDWHFLRKSRIDLLFLGSYVPYGETIRSLLRDMMESGSWMLLDGVYICFSVWWNALNAAPDAKYQQNQEFIWTRICASSYGIVVQQDILSNILIHDRYIYCFSLLHDCDFLNKVIASNFANLVRSCFNWNGIQQL